MLAALLGAVAVLAGCGRHGDPRVTGTWVLAKVGDKPVPLGKPGYLRVELILRPDGTFAEHSVFPDDKGFTLDETGKYWLSGDKIVMDGGLKIHDTASLGSKEIHSPSYREMFLRNGQIVQPADKPAMVFIRKTAEPSSAK